MHINPRLVLRQISVLKDIYLTKHQTGVALYSGLIACCVCSSMANIVVQAALYHDTGKIGIPDSILFKPDRLTDDEWQIMRQHSILGAELIAKGNGGMGLNGDLPKVVQAIHYHHEYWNGSGYPDKLAGEDIPLISRIISVADAFDAMTTDRPYRKALSVEETVAEIVLYAGKQFDPYIVQVFKNTVVQAESTN